MADAKVLVVEDNVHLLSGITDILKLEDYEVVTAENGADALKILQDDRDTPDVIISDIMMPQMNGYDFLEKVREVDNWVSIPFIFLTAKGEKTDQRRGNMLGADVYLTKPFDANDLLVAVSARLARHRDIARVQSDEMNVLKRNILAVMNHEFRTPLTLVVAYADMLRDFDPKNINREELESFLDGVSSGAGRIRRLIENFITLVEIDSKDAERIYHQRKSELPNLEKLVREAVASVLNGDPRECKFYFEDSLPPIEGDAQFLTMAVRELVDNAVKFSDADQPIEVGIHTNDGKCSIWVKDLGRGIPENKIIDIWEPFFQHNRELYEDQGTGAGLAIVKGLTELHGGTVRAESEVDKGSCFEIILPIA